MSLVRVPIAPVVTLPAGGPALDPITVRHAGPRVAGMFAGLKEAAVTENVRHGAQAIEVHVVPLKRRRR